MSTHPARRFAPLVLVAAGFAAAWVLRPVAGGAEPAASTALASAVIPWEKASPHTGPWGEMRTSFTGETHGTKDMFTAVVVLKPGQAVHPAHRHAEEEYMVLMEGSGRWHLDGKEIEAKEGDVLYAAPWVFHGLLNTGEKPLRFFVVKWSSKGVPAPPQPPGDNGK